MKAKILITVIYLVTVYLSWKSIQKMYSKGGYLPNSDPSLIDVIIIFFPFINFLPMIVTAGSLVSNKLNLRRFFNLDK